jgi:hypothetical protein
VPRKDDTTATFSLQLERAKWAENFFRLIMDGILNILNMGLALRLAGRGGGAGRQDAGRDGIRILLGHEGVTSCRM